MAESSNINRNVPDGIYYGYWSGYECHITYKGEVYKWDMDEGVRGTNCRQIIRVSRGKAFAEINETWHPDQIPDVHFKTIKVIVVGNDGKLKSLQKSVPSHWRYTPESEYELAEKLGVRSSQIINILTYN